MIEKNVFFLLFFSTCLLGMDIYQQHAISEVSQKIRIKKSQLALLENNYLDGDVKFKNYIKSELISLHTERNDLIQKSLSNQNKPKL